MEGLCKLYGTKEQLRKSHIFPRFAVDYLKRTGSQYLRRPVQPNKREQDGPKRYLLSDRAEQEFGKREKWFSENILTNYIDNNQREFHYDENLFYFTISFLWRILLVNIDHPSYKPFHSKILETEVEWRNFLKDYRYPINFDRVYIYFTDRVKFHNLKHEKVDSYMTRALDGTIFFNDNQTYIGVYGKFLRFVFYGLIRGGDESKLGDLKINPSKGKIIVPQDFKDEPLISLFQDRLMNLEKSYGLSENQENKILNEILKDPNKFINSDGGQALHNDFTNLNHKVT
jgi:hypothetical protein